MKIRFQNGTYSIKLDDAETVYHASVSNIYKCKECFMRSMSDSFDRAVDSQLGFATEIQRLSL